MRWIMILTALAFICIPPAAMAATNLKLRGDNRVVTVFTAGEIPDYLQSERCRHYAYEQRFDDTVYLRNGRASYPAAVGEAPGDLETLREHKICLLRLKQEDMLKGERKPVTIYEIDTLGLGVNELRVGANHRSIKNGEYQLESGAMFYVQDNRITAAGQPARP